MTEKLIRDGKVAVLISPEYGAGWSTWNSDEEALLFDPVMAQAIIDKMPRADLEALAKERHPDAYNGGVYQLIIEWVPQGTWFDVKEYDGYESIELATRDWPYQA